MHENSMVDRLGFTLIAIMKALVFATPITPTVPYIPEAYESLPFLQEAANLFKEAQAKDLLQGPIRQLFLDSGMHERYGVILLLHKHFSMETNQRLVDCRNVSTPWTVKNSHNLVVPKYEGFIIPRKFRIFNGTLAPFEFDFSPCTPHEDPDS
ncbi:hypothetical protein I7I51_06148 [Histoplasma capsulatum]|uniref:Uncharacterized protein n=1 Tax=Ajellomyces capsulatus TaxID=5037 RepID=A0A8A1MFM7_AJECA|nr:hypothetical protein I7I51_06148 [Histoplasma capsulatum]